MGNEVEYTRLKGLKEMNFGTFEGESTDLLPCWKDGLVELLAYYGGETILEVRQRITITCKQIMEKADHHCVFACTHGAIMYNSLIFWIGEEKGEFYDE